MKGYIRLLILLTVISLFSTELSAQKKKVEFDLDFASFAYADTLDMVEVYYNISQNDLISVVENGEEYIKAKLTLSIVPKGKSESFVDKDYVLHVKAPKDAEARKNFIGVLKYAVPVGVFDIKASIVDLNSPESTGQLNYTLTTPQFNLPHFAMSDIELANNLLQSEDTTSLFYKNTYEIMPNPANVYGEKVPTLFYYTELYNVNKDIGSYELKQEASIVNAKNVVVSKKAKVISRVNQDIVVVDALPIAKVPTGSYVLQITVTDTVKKVKAIQKKKFFVYNPSFKDTVKEHSIEGQYIASEFASMNEEDVEESFAISKYIATKNELTKWGKLSDLEGKKNFLFQFWTSRDPDPSTPENEYKNEYFKRVTEANFRFGTIRRKGWMTERGRVLLMYGEPSQIDRYPNETDKRPYEIWEYQDIEGGVIFVFGDLTGFNDYSLIHSTKRGEISDTNWQRRLQMVGSSTNQDNDYGNVSASDK
jgi:GWxTD domain-containing protein